jgi:hypothetical protein
MRKQKQTGWPAIGILALLFAGIFAVGLLISGESLEQFYREWMILTWIAGAFIWFCIMAEVSRLKCPSCRSRAIALLSAEEVDRWIGQKIVTENTISVGAFQTMGQSEFKGMTESVAVGRRTIPVTKRRILEKHRCQTCEREFERRVIEEMR